MTYLAVVPLDTERAKTLDVTGAKAVLQRLRPAEAPVRRPASRPLMSMVIDHSTMASCTVGSVS
ncbi:hypothetical protein AB5J56_06120 [Streptomyces sp. R21]|uniref:Uncharacterized protein n=1 Tax=Streptomyces sp. R21 TaxID=3238627 RepID=A0AB39P1B9_9ACTN